jgi:lactate racemase
MDTADLHHQVADAIARDGAPPWHRGARILVAVPDNTRPLDYTATLDPLLGALQADGARVTVLVGLGLHRPMRPDELTVLAILCGSHDAALVQHDPDLATSGPSHSAHTLHELVWRADGIILVGLVEPHQYAGFSGGPKALAIGCAGREAISRMHGLELLRDPGVRIGQTDNNPFHQALWDALAPIKVPLYALQIVPSVPPLALYGPLEPTFKDALAHARQTLFEPHDRPLAWVHLPVAPAKAVSLYQASRAATYVVGVQGCVVAPGGWLLIEAACPEGVGTGEGERACEAALWSGVARLEAELDGRVSAPPDAAGGRQRAYVIARALRTHHIALIGAAPIPALTSMDIPQFETLEIAIRALELDPNGGATLPDVFHRVPILR